MKTICLFANEFPYGSWEPYLETEIKYYKDVNKVYIFSLQLRKEHASTIRSLPKNMEVIPIWYAPRCVYLLNSLTILGDKNLYRELAKLIKNRTCNFKNVVDVFVYLSRAHYEARKIIKKIHFKNLEELLFYSYRFEYQPYVAMIIKKRLDLDAKIISRAHRYDLYEEFRTNNYIPMREILLENIDYVYPCSSNGTRYLKKNFPMFKEKIETKLLGTLDCGVREYFSESVIRIVSCSNVVPVKRIDLIIKALSEIKDITIYWTHYGDGILLNSIRELAEQMLPSNVKADFKGNVKNCDLLKEYSKENYYLFLNVSESEGIPVSIMEAMSFGIPCIATDVGGTKEIIKTNKNGILLNSNFTVNELKEAIQRFASMNNKQYLAYREEARATWEAKYNAEINYLQFSRKLCEVANEV